MHKIIQRMNVVLCKEYLVETFSNIVSWYGVKVAIWQLVLTYF